MSLTWQEAKHLHRVALERFVCTEPASRKYDRYRGKWHPRPWEYEVQSHLRGRRPPVARDEVLLLGFDDAGIAAATHLGFDDTADQMIIFAVARAIRCRGRGYGAEALERALDVCRNTKARYGLDCGAFTRIDPRNEASVTAFKAAGFEYLGENESGYQNWVHDLS